MSVKESVLKILSENKGHFFSGEELSASMSVSRTAVWKAIKALRDEGYTIEAVTNKGYMLMEDSFKISEDSLRACLPMRYKNNDIYLYDSLDSTNITAKKLAIEKASSGTVVIARQQTAGRGRLGRSFYSPREGIYLSIVIRPTFDLSKAVLVTSAAAVAVTEAIEEVCGISAGIKWVNDVYIENKKVCGILSEGITDFETGQIESIILGIGINTTIKGFPDELLGMVGAVEGDYSKSALCASVISHCLDLVSDIESRHFIDTYRKKSILIGRDVNVHKGIYQSSPDEIPARAARVLGINDDGCLMVIYSDGSRESLSSGEVSIRVRA